MVEEQQSFIEIIFRNQWNDGIEITREEIIEAAQKNALGYEQWEVRV
jgi:2-hydroxychromene-2-carboxylate isomerase